MAQTVFPILRYRDADAAIDFLKRAFGFVEQAVHRGALDSDGNHWSFGTYAPELEAPTG